MASTYKDYSYSGACQVDAHRYLLPVLRKLIGSPTGPILDLGCGDGSMACALLADGLDAYGVDASESGIQIARQRFPDRFFLADITSKKLPLPLLDKRFTTVISTEVIEHLYDPRSLIDFARQVLRRSGGGRFILSTPFHGYLKNLALALLGKTDRHYTVLWDGGHIKFFSRKTLETMLMERGFSVTAFTGAGRIPYLWKSMLITAVA